MSQSGIIQSNTSAGATTYATMSGNAAPVAGVLDIIGTTGITTSASGGTVHINGIVQKVKITLNANQILNLNSTPITLIPAAGVDTVIIVIYCVAKFIYGGTTPFTDGADINLIYNGSNLVACAEVMDNSTMTGTQTGFSINVSGGGGPTTPVGQQDNVDLNIMTASPFLGNVAEDNSLIFEVIYYIADLT